MAFGFPKPVRGSALLERRGRRADRKAAEDKAMRAALVRDRMRCRWPGCSGKHRGLTLPVDPCHLTHRGMGGDGSGDRTRRDLVVALCRRHHGLLDAGELDIQPLTETGTDGVLAFLERHQETGQMRLVASETRIGVRVPR